MGVNSYYQRKSVVVEEYETWIQNPASVGIKPLTSLTINSTSVRLRGL